jgi:2-methylcitrate dehydratase
MDIDGKRFLTSMIVAYEIFARLSDATALSRRGWDQGYAIGIATAAGVCNLLKTSPAATAHAVGIAAASNLPLRVTRSGELTPWKNAATAYASRNGVFAALLAAEGLSGPGNAFEGRNGLFEKVTGPFERARAAAKLRRCASDAQSSIEILAHRNQWPARGLGRAGIA